MIKDLVSIVEGKNQIICLITIKDKAISVLDLGKYIGH